MDGFVGSTPWARAASRAGASIGAARLPDLLAHRRYRAYRRAQAEGLVRLLPPDAVRPLYARARKWAVARGIHDAQDPMASFLRFCERLLPLPPFRVWREDAGAHPEAHVREMERRPGGDPELDGFPAEVRTFEVGDTSWQATLNLYRGGQAWRGTIAFQAGAGGAVHHTAEIFREESSEAVRARFREFDAPALRAFLRSARP